MTYRTDKCPQLDGRTYSCVVLAIVCATFLLFTGIDCTREVTNNSYFRDIEKERIDYEKEKVRSRGPLFPAASAQKEKE